MPEAALRNGAMVTERPVPCGNQSMVGPLRRVAVKRPQEAFRSVSAIRRQWESLGYTRAPAFENSCRSHREMVELLEAAGAEVVCLPADPTTTLDSIYVHDPALVTCQGAIILRAGKVERRSEGPAIAAALSDRGDAVLGTIEAPGTAEAGDMVWLDSRTLVVGRGFRTNDEGVRQLSALLHELDVDVIPVHLPYWHGPEEVLHLMSFISLLDTDLAVVYRPLLPVPLCELLEARDIELIDVPETEYATQASNVLALGPRRVVMVAGNPITRQRLEDAGCQVDEIDGTEICFPGAGGPTCLTRPLLRL